MNEKLEKYKGEVMPKPLKRLEHEIEMVRYWVATRCGEDKYEVKHIVSQDQFVVNLAEHTCSCNFWELVGIPCRHAVAAISHSSQRPEDFVHPYYRREAYMATYGHVITPINGQKLWPTTNDPYILPPLYKRAPGRPKKLRRRDPHEDTTDNQTRLRRGVARNKCSRCGQFGHNSRSCRNPVVSPDSHVPESSNQAAARPRRQSADRVKLPTLLLSFLHTIMKG